MSLFDFVKNAGSKLGGKIYDITHDEPDLTTSSVSPEQIAERRAMSISENIEDSGVLVQNLKVAVAGEIATLSGKVSTQSCSEKLTLIAGNQFGISQVDCQLEVVNPEPEAQFYTVQSGDTLGKIAKQFYGDASQYNKIFEANTPMLQDPDKIFVGQNLRIPA